MPVKVKVPRIMRDQVGGEAIVEGSGSTLSDLLEDLERKYPGFKHRIVADDGGIHRFINLYLNDEDVRYLGSLETAVKEGDTVSILPAVAGG